MDVQLAARATRYARPTLRFTNLTPEAEQYAQRLALYRDLLDLPPPGTPSPDELRAALSELERERLEARDRERAEIDALVAGSLPEP